MSEVFTNVGDTGTVSDSWGMGEASTWHSRWLFGRTQLKALPSPGSVGPFCRKPQKASSLQIEKILLSCCVQTHGSCAVSRESAE